MDAYKIDLLAADLAGQTFEYEIDESFFSHVEGIVRQGNLHTTVECLCAGSVYAFEIHSVGTVVVPCDRCLSDLRVEVDTTDQLNAKLGAYYADEGDCVTVPESDAYLDLSQFIYEFVALSIPMTCCHAPGQCDEEMVRTLGQYQSVKAEDAESGDAVADSQIADGGEASEAEMADSRWEALKQLKNKI